jgi:putative hydrolase of the HAD superfamily
MKKNLFFDVGSTLHHPITGNWFITPNFYNILGNIDLDIVLDAIEKSFYLLDEREINTENEEYDMFCKFYYNVLKQMNYPNIQKEQIQALAYDCVYNDDKVIFYDEVKEELIKLSKSYNLYIISDAWPSTYRILKDNNLLNLFKKVYISSELGYKKSDKTLFEIALEDIDKEDENYFIDDRLDLVEISKEFGFIPILIDRANTQQTSNIKIKNLKELHKILNLYKKTTN